MSSVLKSPEQNDEHRKSLAVKLLIMAFCGVAVVVAALAFAVFVFFDGDDGGDEGPGVISVTPDLVDPVSSEGGNTLFEAEFSEGNRAFLLPVDTGRGLFSVTMEVDGQVAGEIRLDEQVENFNTRGGRLFTEVEAGIVEIVVINFSEGEGSFRMLVQHAP